MYLETSELPGFFHSFFHSFIRLDRSIDCWVLKGRCLATSEHSSSSYSSAGVVLCTCPPLEIPRSLIVRPRRFRRTPTKFILPSCRFNFTTRHLWLLDFIFIYLWFLSQSNVSAYYRPFIFFLHRIKGCKPLCPSLVSFFPLPKKNFLLISVSQLFFFFSFFLLPPR